MVTLLIGLVLALWAIVLLPLSILPLLTTPSGATPAPRGTLAPSVAREELERRAA